MKIDPSPAVNPARSSALAHASDRAAREGKPMRVYVGPPGTPAALSGDPALNVWFVRAYDEPAPEGAELFREITPHGCPIVTIEHARDMARHHVAYGWARNPGSTNPERKWTAEHFAAYEEEYHAETARIKNSRHE